MTEDAGHPAGLLTDAEAEQLADAEHSLADDPELRAQIRTRLRATLQDCSVLYPTLPEEDLAAVFADGRPERTAEVRANTQDALGILTLGMLIGGDMIETRLQDTIRSAGVSYGEEIKIDVELYRGPLPSIEEFAVRIRKEGLNEQTFELFEHFLYTPNTNAAVLDDVVELMGMELTPAEKKELDSARKGLERSPQTVVTEISFIGGDRKSQ